MANSTVIMSRKAKREALKAQETLRRSRRVIVTVTLALLVGLILFMWYTVLRYDAKRLVGKSLPDLSYLDFSGKEHRLSDHRRGLFLLVAVRSDCEPCGALLKRLQDADWEKAAKSRVLILFVQRPDPEKVEAEKRKSYAFATGFMKALKEAAALQVVVVPTVYVVVDGIVEVVAYGNPEKVASVVEDFRRRVSSVSVK